MKVFVISNSTIYSEEFVSHVTGSMLWNHTKNDSILQLTKIGHKTKGKHRHQWPERSFSEQVKFSPNFTQFGVKLLTQIAASEITGKFGRKKWAAGLCLSGLNPDGGINLELSPPAAFLAFSPLFLSLLPFSKLFPSPRFPTGGEKTFSFLLFWDQIKW